MSSQQLAEARNGKETATMKLPGLETSLLNELNQMRKEGIFCDLFLKNKSDSESPHVTCYPVHACVLAANSGSLYQILSSEKNIREIHLQFIDPVFDMFIKLIYGETVDIPYNRINDLKSMAQGLGIELLAEMCDEILAQDRDKDVMFTYDYEDVSKSRSNSKGEPISKILSRKCNVEIEMSPTASPSLKQGERTVSKTKRVGQFDEKDKKEITRPRDEVPHYTRRKRKHVKVSFDEIYGLTESSESSIDDSTEPEPKNKGKIPSIQNARLKTESSESFIENATQFELTNIPNKDKTPISDNVRLKAAESSVTAVDYKDLYCDHCDRTFKSMRTLQIHKRRLKTQEETQDSSYDPKGSCLVRGNENLDFDHCGRTFANPKSLQIHKELLNQKKSANVKHLTHVQDESDCDLFDEIFFNTPALKQHQERNDTMHKDSSPLYNKPYTDDVDKAKTTNDVKPKKIILLIHGNPSNKVDAGVTHQSSIRDKHDVSDDISNFHAPTSPTNHIKIENNANKVDAGIIHQSSKRDKNDVSDDILNDTYHAPTSSINQIQLKHNVNGTSSNTVATTGSRIGRQSNYCDHCSRSFPSPAALRTHKRRITNEAGVSQYLLPKKRNRYGYAMDQVYCDHCDHSFSNPKTLQDHKRRLEQKKIRLETKNRVKTKEEKGADRRKKYNTSTKCKTCGEVFATAYLRAKHINIVHEKRFFCKHCNIYIGTKDQYDIHMRRHTGEKPYLCSQCDFQAVSSTEVKLHEGKHHGNGEYICKYCGKVLNSRLCLTRHEYSSHKRPPQRHGERSVCSICNHVFKHRKHYLRHMRQVHHIEPQLRDRLIYQNDSLHEEGESASSHQSAELVSRHENVQYESTPTSQFDANSDIVTADEGGVVYVTEAQLQTLLISGQN